MPLELGTQQVVNKCLLNEGKKRGEAVQGFSDLSFLKRKTGDHVFYYLFYRSFNQSNDSALWKEIRRAHWCINPTSKYTNPREVQVPSPLCLLKFIH